MSHLCSLSKGPVSNRLNLEYIEDIRLPEEEEVRKIVPKTSFDFLVLSQTSLYTKSSRYYQYYILSSVIPWPWACPQKALTLPKALYNLARFTLLLSMGVPEASQGVATICETHVFVEKFSSQITNNFFFFYQLESK